MTRLKRFPAQVWMTLLTLAGSAALVAGVYLLAGLGVSLVVGGALGMAVGLLVDV